MTKLINITTINENNDYKDNFNKNLTELQGNQFGNLKKTVIQATRFISIYNWFYFGFIC